MFGWNRKIVKTSSYPSEVEKAAKDVAWQGWYIKLGKEKRKRGVEEMRDLNILVLLVDRSACWCCVSISDQGNRRLNVWIEEMPRLSRGGVCY